jgi:hypothetical protein
MNGWYLQLPKMRQSWGIAFQSGKESLYRFDGDSRDKVLCAVNDVAMTLTSWRRPGRIYTCSFVVCVDDIRRPPYSTWELVYYQRVIIILYPMFNQVTYISSPPWYWGIMYDQAFSCNPAGSCSGDLSVFNLALWGLELLWPTNVWRRMYMSLFTIAFDI